MGWAGAKHCKNIRISTDILWRVFRTSTERVSYTFVVVNRRNNEVQGPHCNVGPGLRYSVDLWIQTYTEPVPLEYGKLATKYP